MTVRWLALLVLSLLPMPARATAISPPQALHALVLLGSCTGDHWRTQHFTPMADCNLPLGTDLRATEGMSLRALGAGRPLDHRIVGRLPRGAAVRLIEIRRLSATPGAAVVLWATVDVDAARIERRRMILATMPDTGRSAPGPADDGALTDHGVVSGGRSGGVTMPQRGHQDRDRRRVARSAPPVASRTWTGVFQPAPPWMMRTLGPSTR